MPWEVYYDNPPEEIAKLPNGYIGMDKLEFAPNDSGLADAIARKYERRL